VAAFVYDFHLIELSLPEESGSSATRPGASCRDEAAGLRGRRRYFLNLLMSMPITFAISMRSTSCGFGSLVMGARKTSGG